MKNLSSKRYTFRRLRAALVGATLICTLPLAALGNAQTLDGIVAIVDNDVVLASELQQQMAQVRAGLERAGRPVPPEDELRREILDQLIVQNIQLQMANRAGVRISDAQLNQAMARIARQNGMELNQFRQALEADGMSYTATREQVRQEMLIDRVQQGSVNPRIQITDQEISNFLESEEGQAVTAPEYRMLHTLVPLPSNADAEQEASARAYADKLYQRIQSGTDYERAMQGNHPFEVSTTDLGWRKAGDLPSLLDGLTDRLNKGETAAPIRSPSGFHLVKLVDSRGDGEVVPQTRARHILLKPSAIRDDAATRDLIAELRQRILDGESFTELAREYSEDIGSAQEGGDLGWTNPGQLVDAFQNAMDNTEVDAISQPFQSPYGWHIVQVLERRRKDVTEDVRRNVARNFLHQRKYEDELQAWLQKIRDEAYIDYK